MSKDYDETSYICDAVIASLNSSAQGNGWNNRVQETMHCCRSQIIAERIKNALSFRNIILMSVLIPGR